MIWLLLSGFLAPFLYGSYEAGKDASKIAKDAARGGDNLKEGFHFWNLAKRSAFAGCCTVALTAALWHYYGFSWWFGLPYLAYFTAAFGFWFTVNLNVSRIPPLPRFYVSRDARAAISDRLLVRFAPVFDTTPEGLARIIYTGFLALGIAVLSFAIVNNWLAINGF